ncbi:MAG: VWA domain-containing protein [Candidatus Eremiobacteraeota bacterium]|nr:VWA domain-containing protein [Candidatus Eremiobacteraeota bacterium]
MIVDHPVRLLLGLVGVVLFALLYDRLARRMTARDLAYSNVPFFLEAAQPRQWIPRALQALWILALGALVLGISGPHLTVPVPVRDGSVFICIDTSGSMSSTDVFPTRAQAAKSAARAFIEESPQGTKTGIISFAGAASVIAPLNSDHQAVIGALDQIPLPDGATAIGDALKLAAQMLPATGHRVVILITDGVNNTGNDPMEIAQWLGAHHIPVYTVGIGTPNGGLIPGTNEEATIDENALRGYADASGGAYARAENATQLHDALARLGRITSVTHKPVDASLGFAVGGAVGMLLAFLTGFSVGRYP